jgi:hypothetical protein
MPRCLWYEKAVYTLDNDEAVPAAVPWVAPAQRALRQCRETAWRKFALSDAALQFNGAP